ncbi:MAG: polymer-forming cytoskeletal protein [Alphaproteobacteria bacterium]|nr:polymer-forming cytoskeletal protein [Alphaproteobacteria bacterium]
MAPTARAPTRTSTAATPPSFLAADLMVVGTIASTGTVVAEGNILGPCYAAQFAIGESGFVQGNVTAPEISVAGHVKGDLRAVKVQVHAHGVVDGDICYRTLSVEAGGLLNGTCRQAGDPLADMAKEPGEQVPNPAAGISLRANEVARK